MRFVVLGEPIGSNAHTFNIISYTNNYYYLQYLFDSKARRSLIIMQKYPSGCIRFFSESLL